MSMKIFVFEMLHREEVVAASEEDARTALRFEEDWELIDVREAPAGE